MDDVSEPVGMVLGTEDATPLTFWVGVADDAYLQLDDAVDRRRRGSRARVACGSPASSRTCGRATRAPRSTRTCSSSTGACCPSTRRSPRRSSRPGSSPRSSCRRCRGSPPSARAGKDRDEALYFDQMDAATRRRAHPRRRARVPRPRLPGRLAGGARQHLGDLGRRDEDHVRAVPPVRAVPLRRARRLRAEHQGDRVQRQGRGPDVARHGRTPGSPRRTARTTRGSACRAGPFESVGLWAPVRPDAGGQALPQVESRAEGVTRLLLDRPRVRAGEASSGSCSRRPTTSARRSPISWRGSRRYLDRECEDDPEQRRHRRLRRLRRPRLRAAVRDHPHRARGRRARRGAVGVADATVDAFLRRLDAGTVPRSAT